MVAPSPISQRLAEEFFEAVREYIHWAFGRPQQPLPFDRYVQLSLVCGRVINLTDLLPEDVFDALYMLAIDDRALKEELSLNRTYATAARILQELIEAKKESIEKSD